jgi:hypothetical protein
MNENIRLPGYFGERETAAGVSNPPISVMNSKWVLFLNL